MPWDRFPSKYFKDFNIIDVIDTLDTLSTTSNSNYPPYNLQKTEDSYILEIAVAGFNRDEIEVNQKDNVLSVSGKKETDSEAKFVHKGIAFRNFNQQFKLHQNCVVDSVKMENGILTVNIDIVVPENEKPKTFKIE